MEKEDSTHDILDQIKFSFVIPVYNEQHCILRCVNSILRQNYPADSIEVIVVDDGSTDDTKAVLQTSPVRILNQDHAGPGVARNLGTTAATGHYVIYIDDDQALGNINFLAKVNQDIHAHSFPDILTIEVYTLTFNGSYMENSI